MGTGGAKEALLNSGTQRGERGDRGRGEPESSNEGTKFGGKEITGKSYGLSCKRLKTTTSSIPRESTNPLMGQKTIRDGRKGDGGNCGG